MGSNFFKSLFVFISYFLAQVLIHISLISSVTFFHLRLGHRLFDIQSWLNDFSFEILTLGNCLSFLLVLKVMQSRLTVRRKSREILDRFLKPFCKKDVASILIFVSLSIFIVQPKLSEHLFSLQLILNLLGIFFLYAFDVLLFAFVISFYPISSHSRKTTLMIVSTLFYFAFLKYIFLGSPEIKYSIVFNLFLLKALLIYPFRRSLSTVFSLLLFGISVTESLLGTGPFYSENYALFTATRNFSEVEYVVLLLLIFGYYKVKLNTD